MTDRAELWDLYHKSITTGKGVSLNKKIMKKFKLTQEKLGAIIQYLAAELVENESITIKGIGKIQCTAVLPKKRKFNLHSQKEIETDFTVKFYFQPDSKLKELLINELKTKNGY